MNWQPITREVQDGRRVWLAVVSLACEIPAAPKYAEALKPSETRK